MQLNSSYTPWLALATHTMVCAWRWRTAAASCSSTFTVTSKPMLALIVLFWPWRNEELMHGIL